MQLKFHHLGVVCKNIDLTLEWMQGLFDIVNITPIVNDPLQNADVCIVECKDGTQIELISGPVVEKFVKKGQFLYHTCWQVEDIDKSVVDFIAKGCLLVSSVKPAVFFDGHKVVFLFGQLGMIELLEVKPV